MKAGDQHLAAARTIIIIGVRDTAKKCHKNDSWHQIKTSTNYMTLR